MVPDLKDAARRLAGEIERRLQPGILLNRDTLQFMASTFSIQNPRDLSMLLADPDGSEAQSLLELLFTPDEAARVELEEIIAIYPFTDLDEQAIINDLSSKKLSVPIHFPDAPEPLPCSPSKHLLANWIRSLRITAQLPMELVEDINQHASSRLRSQIKSTLRNTRADLSRPVCAFLGRLMEKSTGDGKSFLEDLDICLAILSEQPIVSSLYDLFMSKKRRLLGMLQQAKKFERQLAENNIEILIMKGVRAPHIDKTEALQTIARIDAICLAVFGVTDPLLQIPTTVDLGNFSGRKDLDKAFDILS